MNLKIRILVAVLVVGIILIGGWWIWENQSGITQSPNPERELTDEQLLEYAKSPFDKEKMMFKEQIIGKHDGISVKVSFPCSDVCPDNTIRIIRYNISLDKCEKVGGVKKAIYVPFGIGAKPETFCFPKVIVENNIYHFVERK